MARGPVEAKVQASTAAAALTGLALWALGRYVFKGSIPDPVQGLVYVAVAGVVTFGAGYLTRHTPRPDLPSPAAAAPPAPPLPPTPTPPPPPAPSPAPAPAPAPPPTSSPPPPPP